MLKATGMVRKMDNVGRIVFPSELRKSLDLAEGDPIEILVDDNKIVLRKYEPACIFCGCAEDVVVYKGKNVCTKCLCEAGNVGWCRL